MVMNIIKKIFGEKPVSSKNKVQRPIVQRSEVQIPISQKLALPDNVKGRSIHTKVIPTVCNLKNMLNKLEEVEGDFNRLKQWEKRSYKAYNIEPIKTELINSLEFERKEKIKEHILSQPISELGASCIDIYLVAYVSENYGSGKEKFFQYIKDSGISDKPNTAQAIWQVGKGDGYYLGVLDDDGSVRDWEFFSDWLK